MNYGTIEITNEGTPEEPSWSVVAEFGGFMIDHESLDAVAQWLYLARQEGHEFDGVCLLLEMDGGE